MTPQESDRSVLMDRLLRTALDHDALSKMELFVGVTRDVRTHAIDEIVRVVNGLGLHRIIVTGEIDERKARAVRALVSARPSLSQVIVEGWTLRADLATLLGRRSSSGKRLAVGFGSRENDLARWVHLVRPDAGILVCADTNGARVISIDAHGRVPLHARTSRSGWEAPFLRCTTAVAVAMIGGWICQVSTPGHAAEGEFRPSWFAVHRQGLTAEPGDEAAISPPAERPSSAASIGPVVMAGAGGTGSSVVHTASGRAPRAYPHRLQLIAFDEDRVERHGLIRLPNRESDTGLPKVEALSALAKRAGNGVEIQPIRAMLSNQVFPSPSLREELSHGLLLLCVDSLASRYVGNRVRSTWGFRIGIDTGASRTDARVELFSGTHDLVARGLAANEPSPARGPGCAEAPIPSTVVPLALVGGVVGTLLWHWRFRGDLKAMEELLPLGYRLLFSTRLSNLFSMEAVACSASHRND